jgi:hypothetical protein
LEHYRYEQHARTSATDKLGLACDIYTNINEFANYDTLKSFLQPIILTIWFIPFAFLLTVFMIYENIFDRIGFFVINKKLRRFAKRRLIWKGKLNIQKIKALSKAINNLHHSSTKGDIKKYIN